MVSNKKAETKMFQLFYFWFEMKLMFYPFLFVFVINLVG